MNIRPHLLLILGIIAAIAYVPFAHHDPSIPIALLKGAGVALFALYALTQAPGRNGRLIAAVMAFGALGDVLIEWRTEAGAAAFIVGHIIAIWLYVHNRRTDLGIGRALLAMVLPASLAIAAMVTPTEGKLPVLFYTVFVSVMAASALGSRFPAMLTGLGAVMFLVSDLLIFARMGPLHGADWVSLAIWALYAGGQAMIVYGVVAVLRGERA